MSTSENKKQHTLPAQEQEQQPGIQTQMHPQPRTTDKDYHPADKLKDKVAIITGGDSGIGRAVAVKFAQEGAKIVIVYLSEDVDAQDAKELVEAQNQPCLLIKGDIGNEEFCQGVIQQTVDEYGKLDILINNAGEQHPQKSLEDITSEQLERTFRTNIFACFFLSKAALPHLKEGATIVNTTSVTAYAGSPGLLDYSATKGAIVAFTRSLSGNLADRGIRVNAVAPGPIWTPLIPSTFSADKVETFGSDTPMKRPGQPEEVANCYVFLASDDSSYISGQVLHPNGGEIVNG